MTITVVGGAVLVGRVLSGVMLDRFDSRHVAIGFFVMQAAGVLLLLTEATLVWVLGAALLIVLCLGAELT